MLKEILKGFWLNNLKCDFFCCSFCRKKEKERETRLQQSLLLWANSRLWDVYALKIVTVRPLAVTGTFILMADPN